MSTAFDTIHNYHERLVVQEVLNTSERFQHMAQDDLLADVACVALNRLPPRYMRHEVDLIFYLSERERAETDQMIEQAVQYAFEFVQARLAMRARK
jgi:hypothetical protein